MTKWRPLDTFASDWKHKRNTPAYKNLCAVLQEIDDLREIDKSNEELEPDGPDVVAALREQHLKAIQERTNAFERELARSRPVLRGKAATAKIENKATVLAHKLVGVISDGIAFQLAQTYATKMVREDLGADGADLAWGKLGDYARKLSSIPLLRFLCEHFEVEEYADVITQMLLSKQWTAATKRESAFETLVKQVERSAPARTPNAIYGPMLNRKTRHDEED